MRSGILKWKYPSQPKKSSYLSLEEWKGLNVPFLFSSRKELHVVRRANKQLEFDYEKILEGNINFFSSDWKKVDDWLVNINSGYKYDIAQHWTQVQDLSYEAGDIKYVWEKSRFTYVQEVMRYDHHFKIDSSEFVFNEIDDWIEKNPLNMGPNYKCSQEISLRCLNWIWVLYFYKGSDVLDEKKWNKIIHFLNWQIKHVYSNINFSRISVRNNHAVTECLTLYIAGLLFPFLDDSKKWLLNGKKWLEEEINYQVYEDGTFLQFSHNYQRVLAQLLTLGISISNIHKVELSSKTIAKAKKLVNYMNLCCIGKTGEMPNYGNNDGALFFKLTDKDYTDFRPQINALHRAIYSTPAFIDEDILEESEWFGGEYNSLSLAVENEHSLKITSFNHGGIYTISDNSDDSFTFFKCTKYKDRPGQADNMHLDIWVSGVNFLRDSGTFKYNTEEKIINYFAGTAGHNTIVVDGHNQMTKGPRFIWYDWTQAVKVNVSQEGNEAIIDAEAEMFYSLSQPVMHSRKIIKSRPNHWLVIDRITGKEKNVPMVQSWQINPDFSDMIVIKSFNEYNEEINLKENTGYWSEYYGQFSEIPSWQFVSIGNEFHTHITINHTS